MRMGSSPFLVRMDVYLCIEKECSSTMDVWGRRKILKTDAIKDLFTGSLFPCEAVSPKDKGYWDLLREYNQGSEKFISGLSPEERRGFEHMQNCRQEAVQYEIEEAFIQGYSLGVRLTAEAFLLKQDHE